MRFRISELLAATGIIGFGLGSLVRSDAIFETLFYSIALVFILMAVLLAIARAGPAKYFWLGFAIASSSYLGLAHIPDVEGFVPRQDGPELTTQLLRVAYNFLRSDQYQTRFSNEPPPGGFFAINDDFEQRPIMDDPFASSNRHESESQDQARSSTGNLNVIIGGGQSVEPPENSVSFMRIGHAAWSLLIGWISGHFTQFVYVRSHRSG